MKIETKWACGNFLVAMAVDLPGLPSLSSEHEGDAKVIALLEGGIRQIGQRNSDVDKILGAFTKGADGKSKRITGWKRGEVPYTKALADKLQGSFLTLEYAEDMPLNASVEVTEYVPTTAEPKYKEEMEIVGRHESAGDLDTWLKTTVGYAGESHGEDGEYEPAMLASVKAFKIARLKAM